MRKIIFGLVLCVFFGQQVTAQRALETYVDSALVNNIVLKQKNIAFHQAEYALKIAKGMFYPSVDIKVGYRTADGGRNIPLPLGDLLNGVYTTLNQLTQSNRFPRLENKSINFLPQNFYDAKLHATVPIFNAEMIYNKKIKSQKVALSQHELVVYKRELVEKVKKAYYSYLQSLEAIKVYESTLKLAKEGKRVNKSLLENGKGLPAYVLRAKSEIEAVKVKLTAARQQSLNAKRYFNFLINRDLEAGIDTSGMTAQAVDEIVKSLGQQIDISNREELAAMQDLIALRKNVYKMKKSVYYPSLNGFIDVGSQAQNWVFNDQSQYYMVGLQLTIPLFAGNRNHYEIERAQLAIKNARLDLKRVTRQLKLSSQRAKSKLKTAYQNFLSAKKQLKAAEAYQRLIQRGYKAGTNTYIETVDARTQLTKARIAVSINRYKMLKAQAGLEQQTASYNFE